MQKLMFKLGAGIASASLVVSALAPGVLAVDPDQDLEISGNGAGSNNTITVDTSSDSTLKQKNETIVMTEAGAIAKTGDNTANGNVGSGVSIDTGDATAKVKVEVGGGSNTATNPFCGCDGAPTVDAKIAGNGPGSINDISSTDSDTKFIKQKNKTLVGTGAFVKAKTGKNDASGNVGGSVGVITGNAKSKVKVKVNPSSNTLNP